MRALAHPIRLSLIEALTLEGQLTATQAADLVGESPSSCSFHLRQLAKYGFVEEAEGGRGRQRPWRLKTVGTRLAVRESTAPEAAVAARQLSQLYHERALARLRAWWASEHAFPPEWREAAESDETIWWVTPAELRELTERLAELVFAYRERLVDPTQRPPEVVPVEFLAFAFPMRLPDGDGDGGGDGEE
jgi:predicted ArsR family transcriptional regulator